MYTGMQQCGSMLLRSGFWGQARQIGGKACGNAPHSYRGITLVFADKNLFRTAELARRLASALSSRGTWAIENSSERASFRQIQCREYKRALRQTYSPFICLTTT